MSTRGAWGYFDGKNHKATYNHSDSYPDYLGNKMCELVKKNTGPKLKKFFEDLIMVEQNTLVTADDPAYLRFIERADGDSKSKLFGPDPKNFGSGKKDWYYLLRSYQNNPIALSKLGIMIDGGLEFMRDSLFCEWAYIVNVKSNKLEIYEGFQKKKPKGRYGKMWPGKPESRYDGDSCEFYPVGLALEIPFEKVTLKLTKKTAPELFLDDEEDGSDEDE